MKGCHQMRRLLRTDRRRVRDGERIHSGYRRARGRRLLLGRSRLEEDVSIPQL